MLASHFAKALFLSGIRHALVGLIDSFKQLLILIAAVEVV